MCLYLYLSVLSKFSTSIITLILFNNIPEIKSFLPIDISPSSRSCKCPPFILHFSRSCLMYTVESPVVDFIDDSTE